MKITVVGAVLIVATAIVVVLVIRALTNRNDNGDAGPQENQS